MVYLEWKFSLKGSNTPPYAISTGQITKSFKEQLLLKSVI